MLVSVDGVDIDGIVLVTTAGWSVRGQITDEGGGVPAVPSDRIRVQRAALAVKRY